MICGAIDKALADAQRSYTLAKAATVDAAESILAATRGGIQLGRYTPTNAAESLRRFRGWVYAAVRPIAQTIAGQPIRVGTRRKGVWSAKGYDAVKPLPAHPLLETLADPNDLMVSWSLVFTAVASLELTGKAFWWVTEIDGRKQIFHVPTSWVVGFEGSTSYTTWLLRPPGHAGDDIPIDAAEMVYIAYPDPADPHGAVAPLQAAGAAVEADEAIQISQREMFRRGIHPSHALIVGKTVGPDGTVTSGARPQLTGNQRRQLVRTIQALYSGAVNHGEPLILDGLIEDVKRLSSTSQEMDYLGSSEWTKKRILQTFGTGPAILGEELTNRASSLAADIHFCKYTINPKIELISQCLTEWLGPMFDPGGGLVVWIEPCVPKDEELNLRWAQALATVGALTPDEMRSLSPLGLGPMPSGLGRLPVSPQVTVQDAIDREMNTIAMTAGRMVVDDVLARREAGKANGHAHTH